MNVLTTLAIATDIEADLLAIAVSTGVDLATLDALLGVGVGAWATSRKFTGAEGSGLVLPGLGRSKARDVLLVGTGDGSPRALRAAAGKVGREARALSAATVALALCAADDPGRIELLVESLRVGNYQWETHKPEKDRTPSISTVLLVGSNSGPVVDDAARRAMDATNAQNVTRDLVNGTAADVYPETLAEAAGQLASLPGVTVDVWDVARLKAERCVGILGVGQGSARPPRLIRISYSPRNAKGHVALVGKGITFDSGGLSLKPPDGMQTMRCDMAGAATVIGAIQAIAKRGLPIRVDGWIGAAENMTGGNAYKLGDVLAYSNGVTVEIHNTDAEGRLVLADCLIQACGTQGVTDVVDLATLTGAVVVAVGTDFTGLFTADDALAAELSQASVKAGEGMWRLPLHAPYNEKLKSDFAQLKNVGGREAGATTAALFLQHFVTPKVRWAHLDIAGPAFLDRASGMYAAGGTGQMVRTLVTWLESRVAALS